MSSPKKKKQAEQRATRNAAGGGGADVDDILGKMASGTTTAGGGGGASTEIALPPGLPPVMDINVHVLPETARGRTEQMVTWRPPMVTASGAMVPNPKAKDMLLPVSFLVPPDAQNGVTLKLRGKVLGPPQDMPCVAALLLPLLTHSPPPRRSLSQLPLPTTRFPRDIHHPSLTLFRAPGSRPPPPQSRLGGPEEEVWSLRDQFRIRRLPWWVVFIAAMYAMLKLFAVYDSPCAVLGVSSPAGKRGENE